MYRIAKEWTFSAAHHLPSLPAGHKCRRPHGHNYRVQLVLAADALDEHGLVVDYGQMDDLGAYLAGRFDHRDLNEVFGAAATAENLARHLYDFAMTMWPQTLLVRVAESDGTWAEYGG